MDDIFVLAVKSAGKANVPNELHLDRLSLVLTRAHLNPVVMANVERKVDPNTIAALVRPFLL